MLVTMTLNKNTIRNIQNKLKANLLRSALYEKCAQTTIEKINEIVAAVKINNRDIREWDSYRKQNHNGEVERAYPLQCAMASGS